MNALFSQLLRSNFRCGRMLRSWMYVRELCRGSDQLPSGLKHIGI